MKEILDRSSYWKKYPFDLKTKTEVEELEIHNVSLLKDSFYKDLEFGTGGIRGIMGVGTNRLNKYTIGKATQGLSNYLKKEFSGTDIKVVIAYDVRNNSDYFAKVVADVLSANDIKVYTFDGFRTTPQLSFAIRHLNCNAGVVITASHNPPEYNGYKVYWQDGAQVVFPHDNGIISEVNNVKYSEINFNSKNYLIELLEKELDDKFIENVVRYSDFKAKRDNIKIVFTPIHGTSFKSMIPAFSSAKFSNILKVEEQMNPDGNFHSVKSPNPEEKESLKMAVELAENEKADILIGTDPDADRFGIGVRSIEGDMILLNGNQTNSVLTYFLLENSKSPRDKVFIGSTVVSSDIQLEIAKLFDVECKLSLTGFKWIGEMVRKNEGIKKIICGSEESYGFMVGDFLRDKDSITSSLLACEIASILKDKGSSFYEMLIDIYKRVGYFKEDLLSITKEGQYGAEEISHIMKRYREEPMEKILGERIIKIDDYQNSISKDLLENTSNQIELPKSNVLILYTEKGTKVAIRPSGTEPKIKFYFGVKTDLKYISEFYIKTKELDDKLEELKVIFKA